MAKYYFLPHEIWDVTRNRPISFQENLNDAQKSAQRFSRSGVRVEIRYNRNGKILDESGGEVGRGIETYERLSKQSSSFDRNNSNDSTVASKGMSAG